MHRPDLNISSENLAKKVGMEIETLTQIEKGVDVEELPLFVYESLFDTLAMDRDAIAEAVARNS